MAPVFSLVLDEDVSADIALMYPELYRDLMKVHIDYHLPSTHAHTHTVSNTALYVLCTRLDLPRVALSR